MTTNTATSRYPTMHQEWLVRLSTAKPCAICGGPMMARDPGHQHERCRLRRLRGLPTPRFSTIQPCTCCGAGEGNR